MFFTPITKALSIGTVSLCQVHDIIGMVDLISSTARVKYAPVGPGIVWSILANVIVSNRDIPWRLWDSPFSVDEVEGLRLELFDIIR